MNPSFFQTSFLQEKISPKRLSLFTHQLATLLHAGMPLLPSLMMLEEQQSKSRFKKIVTRLIASLHEGESLSHALGHYPTIFSHDYRSMVKAGEQGGILGDVLEQIATLQDQRQQLQQKLFSILLYPMIVLIVALSIIGVLLFFVVPKFETIFLEMFAERALPPLTQLLLDGSHTMINHSKALLLGGVLLLGGGSFFGTSSLGQLWRDRLLLKTPFLKRLFQKNILARLTRSIGTLLTHGIPLLQALELGSETTGSHALDPLFKKIHENIQHGHSLTDALKEQQFFPLTVVHMIEVGEATGQLPKMLLNIAELYEQELKTDLALILTLLEPATILLIALTVGTLIVALFLPLVTMMGELS